MISYTPPALVLVEIRPTQYGGWTLLVHRGGLPLQMCQKIIRSHPAVAQVQITPHNNTTMLHITLVYEYTLHEQALMCFWWLRDDVTGYVSDEAISLFMPYLNEGKLL
jgi:hypothetical protein